VTFDLTVPAVLSRGEVVRDEVLRADRARQEAGWPAARLVVVDERGCTAVRWDDGSGAARLHTRPTAGAAPEEGAVLLGEHRGTAYWAVRGEPAPAGDRADLRTAGAALDALGAGLFTTAVAVLNWHDAARYCSRDGSPTRPAAAGWHRRCAASGHEEYPRTDPAVICLVHDGGDRVLLARQPTWPPRRWSVLAGFVEAGESLEACVEREVHEEVGARVRDVRYLGSQAWPFPRSLMVAFEAVADPDEPLVPQDGEIAEAGWVDRAAVRAALAAGDWSTPDAPLLLPGRVSIARSMLESWADALTVRPGPTAHRSG
jgi:NAD+ diphosphatase